MPPTWQPRPSSPTATCSSLDRREALRAALELLTADGDVTWFAEPSTEPSLGDAAEYLVLGQVRGDRTGLLRGLRVPKGSA